MKHRGPAVAMTLAVTLIAMPAAGADTDIVINEVSYLGTAGSEWVELLNTGADTINVATWWLCARFDYRQLSALPILVGDDLVLGPSEILVVAAGMNLDDTASDLGLYTTSSFASAAAMVDFVQWGTAADVGRSDVAAAKGIWTEVSANTYDFVVTSPAGTTLAYGGINGGGGLLSLSSDFTNGPHSQGAENPLFEDGFESGDTLRWSSVVP